jgi:hypothetical protein
MSSRKNESTTFFYYNMNYVINDSSKCSCIISLFLAAGTCLRSVA